jgi:hypothetical protein
MFESGHEIKMSNENTINQELVARVVPTRFLLPRSFRAKHINDALNDLFPS